MVDLPVGHKSVGRQGIARCLFLVVTPGETPESSLYPPRGLSFIMVML